MKRQYAAVALACAGVIVLAVAAALLVHQQTTPAVLQQHPSMSASPISAYAQAHPAPARPDQPRQGLWLQIPALQIDLPIAEGDGSDRIPYWEALHYPGTAAPGATGNSYLYAHGVWGMFGGLLVAKPGLAVHLHEYASGKDTMLSVRRVVGRVRYNDTSWLRLRSSTPLLTLQTCVDDNPLGDRFIVIAG